MANQPFQSNYNEYMEPGVPGQLVNGEDFNAVSGTVETAAGIGFGEPVSRGAAEKGLIAAAAATVFVGITRRNPAVAPESGDKYAQYREAAAIDEGVVWGRAGAALAVDGLAFWHIANKRWVAGAGAGVIAIPHSAYASVGANNGVVKIRIRRGIPSAIA